VILLDLHMPDMNGVEFIRAVRSTRFAGIPIIVTTAERETSELLRQARELGVAAVVAKPWKPQDQIKTVESIRSAGQPSARVRRAGHWYAGVIAIRGTAG
jgi:CheY-like chemotaxis protein